MTTNTENSGSYKFKTMKNEGLGASKARSINVGDLVAWDSWAESLGWGYMAKIMCFGEDREVILPLITVRKSTLRN
jgi:hypothetical protein